MYRSLGTYGRIGKNARLNEVAAGKIPAGQGPNHRPKMNINCRRESFLSSNNTTWNTLPAE
jgi:hypothetical protein